MDEKLIEEIAGVALSEISPHEIKYFSTEDLDFDTVRLGCIRILEWLRSQAVSLRVRPLDLQTGSIVDLACIRLVEASSLHEIVEIRNNRLAFSEKVSTERAQKMMLWAKENYQPSVLR